MKLVVHELKAEGLHQVLRSDKRVIVEAVRPHLYRHNVPAGSVRMQIYSGEDLVAESNAVDISTIGSLAYFHGYVTFYINAYLDKDVDYTFSLYSDGIDGYTFSEPAYVGWCVGFDLGHYDATYVMASNLDSPLDLEIWSRSER